MVGNCGLLGNMAIGSMGGIGAARDHDLLQMVALLLSPLSRCDLDIGPAALAFEGILTPDEADALMACGEAILSATTTRGSRREPRCLRVCGKTPLLTGLVKG